VTGRGTGTDRQFADSLATSGVSVVICGRRLKPLERAAAAICSQGGSATTVSADVTIEAEVRELVERVGPIDIPVNNAGYGRLAPWTEVPLDGWREVMAVNVKAPFRLTQLFVPPMIERGWGRIVNVASVYGVVAGNPHFYPDFDWDAASYVTSKHALVGLAKYLAVRTGGTRVTVSALSPGMFPDAEANRDRCSPESRRRLSDFTPLRRTGNVEDLSSALLYLVSPNSTFVTGKEHDRLRRMDHLVRRSRARRARETSPQIERFEPTPDGRRNHDK